MLEPTVHVLLATCQGEAFLKQQLDSLTGQSYTNWQLHISDDGSTDRTRQIVADFIESTAQLVTLCDGPCKGVTHNFFNLIHTVPNRQTALYAFCDQDDVWLPDKLHDAVAHFQKQKLAADQLYLYCSNCRDRSLEEVIYKRQERRWSHSGIKLVLHYKRSMSTRNGEGEECWNDQFRCQSSSKVTGG